MADIVKISDATALAMHSMVQLAIDYKQEQHATTAGISEQFGASRHHLAKVHQRLSKAGLIKSSRGPAGGIALARDPATITLLDIYEVMEGPMADNSCLFGHSGCPRCNCVLADFLPRMTAEAKNYFKNTTINDLASKSHWKDVE